MVVAIGRYHKQHLDTLEQVHSKEKLVASKILTRSNH